ncbi:MAG: hypothetical protein K2H60_15460 [Muribaculaceae bacterium]|nr:hypothetical protein [Muribaculaceae bacterium]
MNTSKPLWHPVIILFLTVLCALFQGCGGSDLPHDTASNPLPAEAIENLNATIEKSGDYQKIKEARLDSIKATATNPANLSDQWLAYVRISENYRQMEVDSAIAYADKALSLAPLLKDSVNILRGELAFVDALSTAGIFPPALHRLDSLKNCLKSTSDKISYWQTARRCYSYIMTWGGNNEYYSQAFRKEYKTCDDSLLKHLPESDSFHQFIYCERLVDEQRWADAQTRLEALIASLPQETNLYAMATYQLAMVHRHKGNFKDYAKYLALAAESDIKGCVREGLALPTLSNWVYEHGDLDNAFRYVNYTLEDANSGNIRMRTTTIAPIIPLIDTAIQRRSKSSRNQMIAYIIITTVLFIATIILLIFTFISLKKQRQSQEKLAVSSKKLESYVGNFIGLCSNYAARLDQLSKLVTRKIAAGQSEDLAKLVSSGKFAEDNNEEFYHLIDKALLDIFPDFVEQINTLLLPDKRISLAPDEQLSPELRIYAFVRLGVDQSNRIAQILGYSVNTVYAYRNRMRNRATDRENFDSQVANLG